ncbi:MAG: glycosyltransferase [Microthrixaceae bacterium]
MANGPTPLVRVVVVNWNSAWFTARCLRSLLDTEWPADRLEIVVVDNGSYDGSLEQLVHQFPRVRFIRNADNLGFAEGCNRAMRDLDGVDHVALVNNDAVVEPGWLKPLVDALERDPSVGASAARLVLEPTFVPVDLTLSGDPCTIEKVLVGGVDATARTQFIGATAVGDVFWPMDIAHHVSDRARLMVPVGIGGQEMSLSFRGRGRITVSTPTEQVSAQLDGETTAIHIAAGHDRVELLNGIGTDRGSDSEGFDRHFGEPVGEVVERHGGETAGTNGSAAIPGESVPGFCGGGVLLRSEMLRSVGLFDPRYFAYYEDMDLSWRATRAGWKVLTAPESVIRHAFGGSGGSASTAFFFLNYRNWLLTVIRNGDASTKRRAFRSAWDRIKWALKSNVLAPLRHGRRPRLRLTLAWGRVVLAVFLATPGVMARRRLAPPGTRPTDRVRSRLQPASRPGPPSSRPGGPAIAYVDLTAWFEQPGGPPAPAGPPAPDGPAAPAGPAVSAVAIEALEQFLTTTLMIQAVPVRRADSAEGGSGAYRRLTAAEMGWILEVPGPYSTGDSGLLDVTVPAHGSVRVVIRPDGEVILDSETHTAAEALAVVVARHGTSRNS